MTLPFLGPVPIPFILLILGLIGSFIVARALALHAGWLGAQWARALANDLRVGLERAVADEAFSPLDRVDNARRSLWQAAPGARDACGQG